MVADTYAAAVFALEVKSFQPTDVRAMALLEEMGYTQIEIADLLGTTWRAVESRLRRYKDKAGS